MQFQEVFYAKNIREALTLYEAHTISIILSDIKLNKENGLDFIQKVRII